MKNHKLLGKSLAVGLIILFLTMSVISTAGITSNPSNTRDAPIPHIERIIGENDWHISSVIITFSYDPGLVQEIQYYLNGGWHLYTDSGINIEDDGVYNIPWYWVDKYGETYNGWPIGFMIDQTPPTITLTKKSGLNDQVTFTATVNDLTSGVERVEFYLDDELQETVTNTPYQWIWTGTTSHSVYAIAYDYAGHSKKSDTLNTPYNFVFSNSVIYNILQKLNYITFTF